MDAELNFNLRGDRNNCIHKGKKPFAPSGKAPTWDRTIGRCMIAEYLYWLILAFQVPKVWMDSQKSILSKIL